MNDSAVGLMIAHDWDSFALVLDSRLPVKRSENLDPPIPKGFVPISENG
jgi:hypothetical protein